MASLSKNKVRGSKTNSHDSNTHRDNREFISARSQDGKLIIEGRKVIRGEDIRKRAMQIILWVLLLVLGGSGTLCTRVVDILKTQLNPPQVVQQESEVNLLPPSPQVVTPLGGAYPFPPSPPVTEPKAGG